MLTWNSGHVGPQDILDTLGRALRRLELSGLSVADAAGVLAGRRRGSLNAELRDLDVHGLQIRVAPPSVTRFSNWHPDRTIC